MLGVDRICDDLLNELPVNQSLELCFSTCNLKVLSNSSRLIDQLRCYYAPFVTAVSQPHIVIHALEKPEFQLALPWQPKNPEPNKTRIKEEFVDLPDGRVVRKRLTGMIFVFGGGQHLAVGPCEANDNQVVNFINNRYLAWKLPQGCLLYHAAAVSQQHNGIALAGFSTMGKSTLALQVMSRGVDFISNDRLLVQGGQTPLQMFGVPKLPRINPGTILNNPNLRKLLTPEELQHYEQLPAEELWRLEHKYDAYIDRCFGPDRFRLQARVLGLVVLNWQRNGQPLLIQPVDLRKRADLLPAFMKSTGLFFGVDPQENRRNATADEYVRQLVDLPIFELSGVVDFQRAADWIWTGLTTTNLQVIP